MKISQSLLGIGLLGTFFLLSACQKESSSTDIQNPGKELVMESIKAHGGIEKWRSNGALQFQWTYHMTDRDKIADSVQVVDPVTFEATHTVPNSELKFGRIKDGRYWVSPADGSFFPPVQFWTLTPIYFIGIPFVFDDSQVIFELLDEPKTFEGKDYTQVKASYQAGAGESPDDYYVLLIDPETKLVRGAYYTVTSPLVFKGGIPIEKFISLDDLKEVDGLLLAGAHKTYTMEEGVIGEQLRYTDISQVDFLDRDKVDFSAPEGAKFLDPVPTAEKSE